MMDFSYFAPSPTKPAINSPEQIRDETLMLNDIAEKLGCYDWQYKDDFAAKKGTDTNEHFGPVAQELLSIPGLAGAVIQSPDGTLAVDTNYAALAALGLVAALARIVLDKKGETEINDSSTELPGAISDNPTFPGASSGASSGADSAPTENGEGITDGSSGTAIQPGMEAEDTGSIEANPDGGNGTASTAASEPSNAAPLSNDEEE